MLDRLLCSKLTAWSTRVELSTTTTYFIVTAFLIEVMLLIVIVAEVSCSMEGVLITEKSIYKDR